MLIQQGVSPVMDMTGSQEDVNLSPNEAGDAFQLLMDMMFSMQEEQADDPFILNDASHIILETPMPTSQDALKIPFDSAILNRLQDDNNSIAQYDADMERDVSLKIQDVETLLTRFEMETDGDFDNKETLEQLKGILEKVLQQHDQRSHVSGEIQQNNATDLEKTINELTPFLKLALESGAKDDSSLDEHNTIRKQEFAVKSKNNRQPNLQQILQNMKLSSGQDAPPDEPFTLQLNQLQDDNETFKEIEPVLKEKVTMGETTTTHVSNLSLNKSVFHAARDADQISSVKSSAVPSEKTNSLNNETQIAPRFSISKSGNKANLHITQGDLGDITAKIEMNQNSSSVTFITDNAEAKQVIQGQLSQLKSHFTESDLVLIQANVEEQLSNQNQSQKEETTKLNNDPGVVEKEVIGAERKINYTHQQTLIDTYV